MKKKTYMTHVLSAFICCAGAVALTGCGTDDGIDLNDIDTTIGINTDGFTLPSSSTSKISLADVLDLKEDGIIVTLENGDYKFVKSDVITTARPKVKQVVFETPAITDNAFTISEYLPPKGMGWGSKQLPEQEITIFTFSSADDTKIEKLVSADVSGTIGVTLNLGLLNTYFNKVDVEFDLPPFIKFKDGHKGTLIENKDAAGNITSQTLSLTMDTKDGEKVELALEELRYIQDAIPTGMNNFIVVNRNGIDLQGKVKMKMTVKEEYQQAGASGTVSASIGTHADISSFVIDHAEGYFNPTIDPQSSSVDITGIPDFLNDDQVSIKLSNPSITLTINNNIDIKGIIDGTMTAKYKDGSTKVMKFSKTNSNAAITLNPHTAATGTTATKIVICRKPSNEVGAQYVVKDGTGAKEAGETENDLANILQKIPEKLDFSFNFASDITYKGSVDLYDAAKESVEDYTQKGRGYEIVPKYDFEAPLSMSKGSSIVYNDTLDGWHKDLVDKDIDFRKGGVIVVNAKVSNQTPMKLYLDPVAIAEDAKQLSEIGVTVTTDTKDAQGCYIPSNYGTSNSSNLKITLQTNASDTFKKLDGLLLKVRAVTDVDDVTLNSKNQTVQIYDMKLQLTGKVTLDIDK